MSITDKTYKKLAIQVSLNGLSFCVFDTLSGKPVVLHNIHFDSFQRSAKIEDLFASVFREHSELSHQYDEIEVLHSNNLSTLAITFAARPVGASKTYFLLISIRLFTMVEITVVFPVPAYPFNTKMDSLLLLSMNAAIF